LQSFDTELQEYRKELVKTVGFNLVNSTQKFKKGFTLIELMVVIVIIGILAAIAVPKLFGMSAKAKASEVGPAVGTWYKLQQVYVMEMSKAGSFAKIGYTPPGIVVINGGNKTSKSTNFLYYGTPTGEDDALRASWTAELIPTNKLGDCQASTDIKWSTSLEVNSADGKISMTASLPTDSDCSTLTPNFEKLQ